MLGAIKRHDDAVLAILVLLAGVATAVVNQHDVLVRCATAVLVAAAVAVRRRRPVASFVVVQVLGVAVTAQHLGIADTAAFVMAHFVVAYTVAVALPLPGASAGLALGLVAFWCQDLMLAHPATEYMASAVLVAAPWAVGRYVRRERGLRATLKSALDAERAALARAAVADERQRIAREMHQIVTHGLSAIAVQSHAADAALIADPQRVRTPVAEINRVARRCIDEMRVLLTVLRSDSPLDMVRPDGPTREGGARRRGVIAGLWSVRDWLLAGSVLALGLGAALTAPDHGTAPALAVALAVPVVARRRSPLPALAALCTVVVAVTVVRPQHVLGGVCALAALLVLFPAAVQGTWRSPAALGLALAGFWSSDAVQRHPPSGYLASAVTVGGVWSVGTVIRRMSTLRTHVAAATEAERSALAAGAAADERRRLAREMHDVVAHGLSAIALWSDAADAALGVDPARVQVAVRTIASLAVQCASEMRELFHILGGPEPVVDVDLPAVLAAQASLGLTVRTHLDPAALDLLDTDSAVAHAAARIVQEALTNVRRHSRAALARVELCRDGDAVRLEVDDPGPARSAGSGLPGHGTTGIRERAAALGGECAVGPYSRGWRVTALLPAATGAALGARA